MRRPTRSRVLTRPISLVAFPRLIRSTSQVQRWTQLEPELESHQHNPVILKFTPALPINQNLYTHTYRTYSTPSLGPEYTVL